MDKNDAVKALAQPGNLRELTILGLFLCLDTSQKDGVLEIDSRGQQFLLFIKHGYVCHVQSPRSQILLQALMRQHRLLPSPLLKRMQQLFSRTQGESQPELYSANFLQFLQESHLIDQQTYLESHKLLTLWQLFELFFLKTGKFSFANHSEHKARHFPSIGIKRTIWKWKQILDAPSPLKERYPWEKPLNLGKPLKNIPIATILQACKNQDLKGTLTLHPTWWQRMARSWKIQTFDIVGGRIFPKKLEQLAVFDVTFHKIRVKRLPQKKMSLIHRELFLFFFREEKILEFLDRARLNMLR